MYKYYIHVHVYSTQQHPHTQSNYNMWFVQFILTYVLHFLYNQQNYNIQYIKEGKVTLQYYFLKIKHNRDDSVKSKQSRYFLQYIKSK